MFDEVGNISLVVVNARDMSLLNNMRTRLEKSLQESHKLKETLKEINLLGIKRKNVMPARFELIHLWVDLRNCYKSLE